MRTKEDLARYQKLYRQNNKEKIKETERKRNLKRDKDPIYIIKKRNSMLKRKYGISQEEYELILDFQNGSCAICFAKPVKNYLHVDHCHKTGRIRGLLCHQCNWYLGKIDKDREMKIRLSMYSFYKLPWHDQIYLKQKENRKMK